MKSAVVKRILAFFLVPLLCTTVLAAADLQGINPSGQMYPVTPLDPGAPLSPNEKGLVPSPPQMPATPALIPDDRGAYNPRTGERYPSSGKGVYNPSTGEYYPSVGNGYYNPRTGEFYPKIDR